MYLYTENAVPGIKFFACCRKTRNENVTEGINPVERRQQAVNRMMHANIVTS